MACIQLEKLTRTFLSNDGSSRVALDELSLSVAEHEFVVLLGPSGCGKTTTLRLIAGLDAPDSGVVRINNRSMEAVQPKDRDIAMVFQRHALYPHMTIAENIAFGLRIRGLTKSEIASRIQEAAELLQISDCLRRIPGELSGGERQRAAIARALARRPSVLLFDEPLSNLDAPMRARMRAEFTALRQHWKATVLYVTHDQSEAMALGDRIAVMNQGKLEQISTPQEIYRNPVTLFVARFVGTPTINLLPGVVASQDGTPCVLLKQGAGCPEISFDLSSLSELGRQQTRRQFGREVLLGVRPEHITLNQEGGLNTVASEVVSVQPLGPETHVNLATSIGSLNARCAPTERITVGQSIQATFDLSTAVLFDAKTGNRI